MPERWFTQRKRRVLSSATAFSNSGVVSGSERLAIEAETALTNAAVLISGNDHILHADQVINYGGVIWANDSITISGGTFVARGNVAVVLPC